MTTIEITNLRPSARHAGLSQQAEQLVHETRRRKVAEERLERTLRSRAMASWECELDSGNGMQTVEVSRVLATPSHGGWSRQDLIDAFIPSDREAIARAFAAASVSGSIDIEARVEGPDATRRWLRIEGRVYPDATGRLVGLLSDVTALHADQDRLRRASELEAVGQLAAGIAHDLNNFLHVIGNNLELLGRGAGGDERVTRLSGSAQRALLRAAKLSRQLLTFSHGQELQLERVSLRELVASVRELLDRALPGSVRVKIEGADDVWSCTADVCQLEAALLNLAINARDAMPDGGALHIGFDNRHVGAEHASSWGVAEGDYVRVSVCDTGTGMSPDVAARAFEPFFTTKDPLKGTGLGLSQVYAFAKRSHGFVNIETELGRGSRVRLFLPRDE